MRNISDRICREN